MTLPESPNESNCEKSLVCGSGFGFISKILSRSCLRNNYKQIDLALPSRMRPFTRKSVIGLMVCNLEEFCPCCGPDLLKNASCVHLCEEATPSHHPTSGFIVQAFVTFSTHSPLAPPVNLFASTAATFSAHPGAGFTRLTILTSSV